MISWLLHDDQNELFEIVFAVFLNFLFLIVAALLLWILDRETLAFQLGKGSGVLWVLTFLVSALLNYIQRFFRVDLYKRSNLFLVSNLIASCILQMGWSAFAALEVREVAEGASGGVTAILYLIGAISCFIAFNTVSSFYHGHFYRLISLPIALASFVVFSAWPVSAKMLYGWLF